MRLKSHAVQYLTIGFVWMFFNFLGIFAIDCVMKLLKIDIFVNGLSSIFKFSHLSELKFLMCMNNVMGIHNHVHKSKIRTSKMLFFLIVICILLTVAVLVFKTWRQIEPTREIVVVNCQKSQEQKCLLNWIEFE